MRGRVPHLRVCVDSPWNRLVLHSLGAWALRALGLLLWPALRRILLSPPHAAQLIEGKGSQSGKTSATIVIANSGELTEEAK